MQELGDSVKYVPSYQLIERIRKEEKAIAKGAIKDAEDKVKNILISSVNALAEKGVSSKQIAEILGVSVREVNRVIKNK